MTTGARQPGGVWADEALGGPWVITGAAGYIGGLLVAALDGQSPKLRLLDVVPGAHALRDVHEVVDLRDLPALVDAFAGAHGVVHLAGLADEADFQDLLDVNVLGTYNVFEAARRSGIKRVVFASSNHVTGFYPAAATVDSASPVRPDSLYAVSKAAGEAIARMYSDKFGIEVVCVRIGSCLPAPVEPRHQHTWLSERDAVSALHAAMTAQGVLFETFYAVSDNRLGWWAPSDGARLGFVARDGAGELVGLAPDALQGGDFAAAEYTLSRQRDADRRT